MTNTETNPTQMETIVIEHTWSSLIGAILAILENGNAQGKQIARDELVRMAKIADKAILLDTELKSVQRSYCELRADYEADVYGNYDADPVEIAKDVRWDCYDK
jgi:hypothetical protein